jgi:ABC-type amino acid transport substrate-binding protein
MGAAWLSCVLALLSAAFTAAADAPAFPPDIARIKERGTLVVAQFQGSRPGFFIEDDTKRYPSKTPYEADGRRLVGFDVDLAQKIASELGVQLKIVRTFPDFNAACRSVTTGGADIVISKLSVTYQRCQYVAYSRPYVTLRVGLLVNRLRESQAGRDGDPAKLCNHPSARIGIVERTSFVDFCKERFPDAQHVTYPNQDELFKAVRKGQVLAAFYDEFEIRKAFRLFPDMSIYCREAYLSGHEDLIAMAVNPQSQTLLSFVNMLLTREGLITDVDYVLTHYLPGGEASAVSAAQAPGVLGVELVTLVVLMVALGAGWMWPAYRARRRRAAMAAGTEGGAA